MFNQKHVLDLEPFSYIRVLARNMQTCLLSMFGTGYGLNLFAPISQEWIQGRILEAFSREKHMISHQQLTVSFETEHLTIFQII